MSSNETITQMEGIMSTIVKYILFMYRPKVYNSHIYIYSM